MRLLWGLLGLAMLLMGTVTAQDLPEEKIRQVLGEQVLAWNRGDIPGFMAGYEAAETTTFIGAAITRGHQQILDRYLQRYPNQAVMGTLTFSELEVSPLGPDYASVVGRWRLDRAKAVGGNGTGIFTLILRNTPTGWKIIQDHTR